MVWFAGWLWQGLALTLLTALVLHTSRAVNAATRYALWWLTLVAVFTHPLLSSLATYIAPSFVNFLTGNGVAEPTLFAFTVPHVPSWVIGLGTIAWLGVIAWNAGRFARAVAGVRELRRSAVPVDPALEQAWPLWREASRTGRRTYVYQSDGAPIPCALGLGRPLVIIPTRLLHSLASHDLDQIIVHEHAHLQRYDDWGRFLQVVIELLVPFHPAVRWIAARLDLEREIASDDWVIAQTGQPTAYARCLTRLAEQVTPATAPALTPAALRRRAQMLSRVERLLDPSRNARPRISAWAAIALAFVMVSLAGRAEHLLGIREAGDFDPIVEVHAEEALASHQFAGAGALSLSRLPTLVAADADADANSDADTGNRANVRGGVRPAGGARTPEMAAALRRPLPPSPVYRRSSVLRADAPEDDDYDEVAAALRDLDDRRPRQLRPVRLAFERIAQGSAPPDDDDDDLLPSNPLLLFDNDSAPSGLGKVAHPDHPLTAWPGTLAPPPLRGAPKKPLFFHRMGRSVARLFGLHVRSPGHKLRSDAPRRTGRGGRQAPKAA
jgi:beta-lactamase regulating signal transducer with metallopeptidase domain